MTKVLYKKIRKVWGYAYIYQDKIELYDKLKGKKHLEILIHEKLYAFRNLMRARLRSTLKLCAILFGVMAIVSCSASWHLNRAIKKGAKQKTDTTYIDVITERTKTDTVALLRDVLKHDTIFLTSAKWSTKTVIKSDTIWQEVTCEPDTIRVPFKVETTIKAPQKFPWYVRYLVFPMAAIGLLLLVLRFRL